MNEKQLKMGLRLLAEKGWFGVQMTDELAESLLSREYPPSSDERKDLFISRLRIRIQDASIRKAKRVIDPAIAPFGVFIGCLRECAQLTRAEIASRLGKEKEFVKQIERGVLSPLDLPPMDIADLVILFQIKIRDMARLVNAGLDPSQTHPVFGSTAGRLPSDVWNRDAQATADMGTDKDSGLVRRGRIPRSFGLNHEVQGLLINLRSELRRRGQVRLLA
jgi:hypothetical protein